MAFILQANLVQAPAAAATEAATAAATAAAPSGMPIEQQLQDLQRAIELAKLKLQLAETHYSTLETLSKRLATAQKDAAATFSRTQVDIAADITATRTSIEGSAFLPARIDAALVSEDVAASGGAARPDAVQAAYEAAAANINTVDAAAQAAAASADVDVSAAVAQTAQAALGSDAVAQTAQAAADVAGFEATLIILVTAFLSLAFTQFNELMSVPRVMGDSANSGGGTLPSWASLAAYADSKNRSPAGAGRSAPQIVFRGLVNLEKEGVGAKGWLYGGQKDWQKGYVFRQAAAPSALYSNLPDLPVPSSAEAPATAAGAATAVLAAPEITEITEVTEITEITEIAKMPACVPPPRALSVVAKEMMAEASGAGAKGKKAKKVRACTRTQTDTNTHIDTHRHTQTHTDTHRHTHRHTRTHTHTHTQIDRQTDTHTHTHSYIHGGYSYIHGG